MIGIKYLQPADADHYCPPVGQYKKEQGVVFGVDAFRILGKVLRRLNIFLIIKQLVLESIKCRVMDSQQC